MSRHRAIVGTLVESMDFMDATRSSEALPRKRLASRRSHGALARAAMFVASLLFLVLVLAAGASLPA